MVVVRMTVLDAGRGLQLLVVGMLVGGCLIFWSVIAEQTFGIHPNTLHDAWFIYIYAGPLVISLWHIYLLLTYKNK